MRIKAAKSSPMKRSGSKVSRGSDVDSDGKFDARGRPENIGRPGGGDSARSDAGTFFFRLNLPMYQPEDCRRASLIQFTLAALLVHHWIPVGYFGFDLLGCIARRQLR